MSIYTQIYNAFGDWRMVIVTLILASFSFKRGLRNSKYWEGVYKRNEKDKNVGKRRKW